MTQVKVCGISDPIAFDTAVEAGADWLGFVFFPPSPRYVTPLTAATLSGRISGGPSRVGLFVDPTEETIAQVLEIVKLDILQLYRAPADLAADGCGHLAETQVELVELGGGFGNRDPSLGLLHRRQIDEWMGRSQQQSLTMVPLSIYFKDGRAKVELALARGRRQYDKRHAIATRPSK